MSDLLFIRHAETGMAGRFCGHSDPPVNARGHQQIQALLKALEANPIEAIYTSNLQRAVTTAEALVEVSRCPFVITPTLREIAFGDWEGLTWQEVKQRDSTYARKWSEAYPDLPAPGGESFEAFQTRVLAEVKRLLALASQKRLAVVTHAGVMRVVLRVLCGLEEQEAWEHTKPYCCFFEYTPQGGPMSDERVRIRELAAWDLDDYEYRPDAFDHNRLSHALWLVSQRSPFETASPLAAAETAVLSDSLATHAFRPDLQAELAGLEWCLGVIDLRYLLAFQRRLAWNPSLPQISAPAADNWPALVTLSFGPAKPVVCDVIHGESTVTFQSRDPNLHFRISTEASNPVTIHAGSPFFEVAQYLGRWFLRDGYHRAYMLLRAGIFRLPAVIVHAATLRELGAVHPWFFPEEILFSSSPPRVTDFLDDALILEYDRPPLIKTLRVTMEEALTPAGEHL